MLGKKQRSMLAAGLLMATVFFVAAIPAAHAGGVCGTWTAEEPLLPDDVFSAGWKGVTVIAPDDIWAVGTFVLNPNPPFGTIEWFNMTMHYDGSSWTLVPAPSPPNPVGEVNNQLFDVAAVSATEVYATGWYEASINTTDTLVLKWDGSSWEHIISPGQSSFGAQGFLFDTVAVADADNIWFGGHAVSGPNCNRCPFMVHYDGSNFAEYFPERDPTATTGYHRIRDISIISPDDIWAAGGIGGSPQGIGGNYVTHWDGTSWSHVPTPKPGFGEVLRAVVAVAPDDVWVAGQYQISENSEITTLPLFLHWNGSSWTQVSAPDFVYDLYAFASDDIYGVGFNAIQHWDGVNWSVVVDDLGVGDFFLGAFDSTGPCSLIAVGTPLAWLSPSATPGDLDGDGDVDIADLGMLLADFGCAAGCSGDADGDGDTDISDLGILLANFGA